METLSALSDGQLVSKILDGDMDAAAHLLAHRCGPGIKYLVQGKYRSLGLEFHEVVNELFLLLRKHDWKALKEFRGTNSAGVSCKLSNYVYCIAARWLSRKMGKTVKENTWTVSLDELDMSVIAQKSPETPQLNTGELMEAVMALPDPIDRAVVVLYKIEDRGVDEVATRLGISTANVYTRCSRAIKAMRNSLREREYP